MTDIFYIITACSATFFFFAATDFYVRANKILKRIDERQIEDKLNQHLLDLMKGKNNA